jgi:hypothetical protein
LILAGTKKKTQTEEDDDKMECSETVKLIKYEEGQRNTHAQGGTEGDSDEEEESHGGAGGQRVQCA